MALENCIDLLHTSQKSWTWLASTKYFYTVDTLGGAQITSTHFFLLLPSVCPLLISVKPRKIGIFPYKVVIDDFLRILSCWKVSSHFCPRTKFWCWCRHCTDDKCGHHQLLTGVIISYFVWKPCLNAILNVSNYFNQLIMVMSIIINLKFLAIAVLL